MNKFTLLLLVGVTVIALILTGCTTSTLQSSTVSTESTAGEDATSTSPAPPTQGTPEPSPEGTPEPTTTVVISTEELANNVRSALARISEFEGTARVSALVGNAALDTTVRQSFKNPRLRLEVSGAEQAEPGQPDVFIYDGQRLTAYFPATNQVVRVDQLPHLVVVASIPQQSAFPLLAVLELHSFVDNVLANSSLTVDGTHTVAGRPTTLLVATPRTATADLAVAHIYVDQETFFPLRVHTVRPDGLTTFDFEMLSFDPDARVSDDVFTFEPPPDATVVSPELETLTVDLGLVPMTIEEAREAAGFPVLVIREPPTGISERFVRTVTVGDRSTVLVFYGDEQRITTTLIENAAGQGLPQLAGAEPVDINGNPGGVVSLQNIVIVSWTQGDTDVTLVTERPRDEAIRLAQIVGE